GQKSSEYINHFRIRRDRGWPPFTSISIHHRVVAFAARVTHSLRLIASSTESGRPLQGSRATVNCLAAELVGHPPWHSQMPTYGTSWGSKRRTILSLCCGRNTPHNPSERRGVNNFSAVPALGEPT